MEVNATEDKDKLLISDPLAYLLEAGFSLEDIERERDHAGISIADQAEAVRRIKERGEDPLEGRSEPPEEPPEPADLLHLFHPVCEFQEEEATWLIPGWIPESQITLIAADGGIGSTLWPP